MEISPGEHEEQSLPLREYWNLLLRRLWTVILVFALVVASVGLYTFKQERIYEAKATVIIDPEPAKVRPIDDGNYQPVWSPRDTYFETQLHVIKSRHVAQRVVVEQGLAENLDFLGLSEIEAEEALADALARVDPVSRLLSMVTVEPLPDTRMVTISVQHANAELAAELANAVAEAYQDQNTEHRVRALADAFHWLEAQYKSYEARLNESGQALTQFKEENPLLFTSPQEQQLLTSARLQELTTRLVAVEATRRQLGHQLEELKRFKVTSTGVGGLAFLAEGANVNDLVRRFIDLQQEEQVLLLTYLEGSQQVQAVRGQITLVSQAIQSEVESIRRGYQGRYDAHLRAERDLRAQVSEVKAEALKLDQLKLLYEQVESQKEEQQRLFELVQRRLNEVSLSRLLESNNIRILDRATTPGAPVRPRVFFNMLLAVVLGVVLGVALAFLMEMLDTTVKSQEDIERKLQMPFLGVIPASGRTERRQRQWMEGEDAPNPYLHIVHYPKSSVAECARTIRTNLMFMTPGRQLDVLLVTSPSPLEGKTTTVVNLSVAMAQSSLKTIVLEADMRRPRLAKALGIKESKGISTVLTGTSSLDEAIQPTQVAGLDILPCGPIPPNPAELFHTQGFKALLAELRERYDRVVIDSPPVIAVTDALILAQQCDGVVIISRAGSTQLALLTRTKQLLEGINAPLVGVILNGVNLENRHYGGTYYYYRQYGELYEEDGQSVP